jgi:FMN phosphatase YigB (HAD superfamily)
MADAVALSIDTKMVKPDPAAYSYVLDRLGGIPPENAIFVGDGENQELEGATAAGFGKVGFLRQYVAKTSFHAPE